MLIKIKNLFLIAALLVSVALNIATVTVQSVAIGVSTLVSAVAGVSAVLPELRMVEHQGQKKAAFSGSETNHETDCTANRNRCDPQRQFNIR